MALRTRVRRLERRPRPPAPRRTPDPRLVAALDAASEPVHAHLRDLHDAGDRAAFDALLAALFADPAAVNAAHDTPALAAWAHCDGPVWTAEVRSVYYGDVADAIALGVDAGTLRGLLDALEAAHRRTPAQEDQRAVRAVKARVRLLLRAAARALPAPPAPS